MRIVRLARCGFIRPINARRTRRRASPTTKMHLFSFARSHAAQTAAIALLTLAALAAFALVAAHWTWQWLAPPAELRGPPAANVDSHRKSAKALFGIAQQDGGNTAAMAGNIRLLGIVAATPGRRGYAVVRLDPATLLTVAEGDDIAPGIRLAEVETDQVVLERGGTRETLGWPAKSTATETLPTRLVK